MALLALWALIFGADTKWSFWLETSYFVEFFSRSLFSVSIDMLFDLLSLVGLY